MTSLLGARASERRLHRLWREQGPRLPALECDDGTRLRVVYPGRPSAAAGPDFRDAILVAGDGRLLQGDVELHLEAEGWQAHGHHQDRRYNSVVLQVVLWRGPDSKAGARLEMGARVPTAALFPVLTRRPPVRLPRGLAPALPFTGGTPDRVGQLLDRAGDARFRAKARAFANLLRAAASRADGRKGVSWALSAAELLYQRLMEALGYTRNREPFTSLAQGVPLGLLGRASAGVPAARRAELFRAVLLGAAGLLEAPGAAPDPATASLREEWRATGLAPVVPAGAWDLFRVRPENHPARRLRGMALLLDRVWDQGLMAALTGWVREREVAGVLAGLTVAAAESSSSGEGGVARGLQASYIGPGRAGEMAVNVLLPFCVAWGAACGDRALREAAPALYRAWPALPENEITREMASRLTAPRGHGEKSFKTARRQQGMLHLYRRGVSLPGFLGEGSGGLSPPV